MRRPSSPDLSHPRPRAPHAPRSRHALATAALLSCATAPVARAQQPQPAPSATRTPDVIFVPTPFEVVDQMLAVARVQREDRLFDLGSGDGRIVITAAKRLGTRGVGIDIDPQRITESRRNADTAGVTRLVEFRQADLFATDLRQATVVTLYLLPALNVKLRPKLFAELRPGTRVVSHSFDMGDWASDSTFRVGGRAVHYWLMPADVAGTWTLTVTEGGAERRHELRLEQRYQQVTGTAIPGGRPATVREARVRGDSVSLTLSDAGGTAPLVLAGRVEGDRISGIVVSGGGAGAGGAARGGSWRAARTGRR
jgi:SAM-dependent methyltransferase